MRKDANNRGNRGGDDMFLIPEPKKYFDRNSETEAFSGLKIIGAGKYDGEELLRRKLWDFGNIELGKGFELRVAEINEIPQEVTDEKLFKEQGYCIKVFSKYAEISCAHHDGLANALSSFKQLLIKHGNEYKCRMCEIIDWPSVAKRSVSNCLTWYSGYGRIGFDMQLFDYDQWLEYLNVCADLKINQFNMCIYGYWPFTMPEYPESEFRNVKVKLYNAETDSFISTTFTHPNLVDEFLGKLIEDAHALGVKMYAYMGLNSYSGGYPCVHKDKRMVLPPDSPYINDFDRMCFSKKENMDYFKKCVRRVVQLGFDGIVFEESEEASWFCDCEECRKNYMPQGKTSSDAMYAASFGLFKEVYDIIKEENPDCKIGIRAFRQQPLIKTEEDMAKMKAVLPDDVMLFWAPGLSLVPESEFDKWVNTLGKERIVARDTESNGISACFGRLIRTFRSNGLRCESEPLQQYIEEDVRQHIASAKYGVAGTNGFMFEWYGFFLHLMVHANYPWGGTMDAEEFYRAATEKLYGKERGEKILYAVKNMLTIHESQLNIFPQFLPFAMNKVSEEDIAAILKAKEDNKKIVADLEQIMKELSEEGARKSDINHIHKLLSANKRNAVIYDMALIDINLKDEKDIEKRRQLLTELSKLNEKNFDIVKKDFFDVAPMDTTGVKSCMIPYHELKRVINNELFPGKEDNEMIYLGVEALGWMSEV